MVSTIEKIIQTIEEQIENILKSSNWYPNFFETVDGKQVASKSFIDFPNENIFRRYCLYTSKGQAFAERLVRTIKKPVQKVVFEKRDANWIDETSSVTKQTHNTKYFFKKFKHHEEKIKIVFTKIG